MAGVAVTRPVILTAPSSRRQSAPITWKPTTGHALPPSTVPTPFHPVGTTAAPPSPRRVVGGSMCGTCGGGKTIPGNTDQGLGGGDAFPGFPPDQVARNPAGGIGSSSGITNPTPVNRAGMLDYGTGILKNTVEKSQPLVSVAATSPVDQNTPAEPTNDNTKILLGVGALVVLVVGVAVMT